MRPVLRNTLFLMAMTSANAHLSCSQSTSSIRTHDINGRTIPRLTPPLFGIPNGGTYDLRGDMNSLVRPDLLVVSVEPPMELEPTAATDSLITLHASTAKELNIVQGDEVLLHGRRQTVIHAIVAVSREQTHCRISSNCAKALHVHNGETLLIVTKEHDEHTSLPSPLAQSVTLSPIKESMLRLEHGMEDHSETAIMERFVNHYFSEGTSVLTRHTILTLHDDTTSVECFISDIDNDETHESGVVDSTTDIRLGPSLSVPKEPLGYASLGGCQKPLTLLRELVELPLRFPSLWIAAGVPTPKGVLLHGPPGCGKTLLCHSLMVETGAHVVHIRGPEIMAHKGGASENNLRKAFEDARHNQPSIIFIDELDCLAPKRDEAKGETEKRIVSQLLTLMDSLRTSDNVIVMGVTNRPNLIENSLRRPGRFDRELEIVIPDEDGRLEILEILSGKLNMETRVELQLIARDTHGYVGADLGQLVMEASMNCIRENVDRLGLDAMGVLPNEVIDELLVTKEHFLTAMSVCDPSTLRENKLEVPDVQWKDIGGLESTKQELQEMIRYPIEHKTLYEQFGMTASRGVLFYGPPGCGKTLMAKAIANECGANFISVKGPELLNMYFGGSEANVRDLFQKARAASPCILFFDEIDSIARKRGQGSTGSSETSDRVINQILSEIDGISGSNTLFIIGATNRPDILDPGIMRPGRLDQLIYIPLPDKVSRSSIFQANLRKSPLDKDISLEQLADVTQGFSGADITEICQSAAKYAIKDSITAEMEVQRAIDTGDLLQEDVNGTPDPVPCITCAHFEASLSKARKSVTAQTVQQYDDFMSKMKQQWSVEDNVYDIDKATSDQLTQEEDEGDEDSDATVWDEEEAGVNK